MLLMGRELRVIHVTTHVALPPRPRTGHARARRATIQLATGPRDRPAAHRRVRPESSRWRERGSATRSKSRSGRRSATPDDGAARPSADTLMSRAAVCTTRGTLRSRRSDSGTTRRRRRGPACPVTWGSPSFGSPSTTAPPSTAPAPERPTPRAWWRRSSSPPRCSEPRARVPLYRIGGSRRTPRWSPRRSRSWTLSPCRVSSSSPSRSWKRAFYGRTGTFPRETLDVCQAADPLRRRGAARRPRFPDGTDRAQLTLRIALDLYAGLRPSGSVPAPTPLRLAIATGSTTSSCARTPRDSTRRAARSLVGGHVATDTLVVTRPPGVLRDCAPSRRSSWRVGAGTPGTGSAG